ncbi:MAG TPA: radical SAM protein, partial [Caulobacteraceae bacterium]
MARSAPNLGAARGRGAKSNRSGRFESLQREDFDDGWTEHDGQPVKLETTLHVMKSKTIITRNDSPDIGFDQS